MFMVFRVYIPHRDGSETAAISKYVSNMIAFLYEIYRENVTFPNEFGFFLKTREILEC